MGVEIAIGATIGAVSAAASGGNILKGAAFGAVSGGVGGAVSSAAAGGMAGGAVGGMAGGATNALLSGGSIGKGALMGGLVGGTMGAYGEYGGGDLATPTQGGEVATSGGDYSGWEGSNAYSDTGLSGLNNSASDVFTGYDTLGSNGNVGDVTNPLSTVGQTPSTSVTPTSTNTFDTNINSLSDVVSNQASNGLNSNYQPTTGVDPNAGLSNMVSSATGDASTLNTPSTLSESPSFTGPSQGWSTPDYSLGQSVSSGEGLNFNSTSTPNYFSGADGGLQSGVKGSMDFGATKAVGTTPGLTMNGETASSYKPSGLQNMWTQAQDKFMQNPIPNTLKLGGGILQGIMGSKQAQAQQGLAQQQIDQNSFYNNKLQDSYTNPGEYLNSPEYQAMSNSYLQQLARQDAAAGRRSQVGARSNLMQQYALSQLGNYRNGLANMAKGTAGGQQALASAQGAQNQAYGSMFAGLGSIFAPQAPQPITLNLGGY